MYSWSGLCPLRESDRQHQANYILSKNFHRIMRTRNNGTFTRPTHKHHCRTKNLLQIWNWFFASFSVSTTKLFFRECRLVIKPPNQLMHVAISGHKHTKVRMADGWAVKESYHHTPRTSQTRSFVIVLAKWQFVTDWATYTSVPIFFWVAEKKSWNTYWDFLHLDFCTTLKSYWNIFFFGHYQRNCSELC